MYPNQTGRDIARVKDKCLLDVNTYGRSPITLVKIIKKKVVKKNNLAPGEIITPRAIFNSFIKELIII
jgi:hypothetical protein